MGHIGNVARPGRGASRGSRLTRAHVLSRRAEFVVLDGGGAQRRRCIRLVPRSVRARSRRRSGDQPGAQQPKELLLTGGGARSAFVRQLQAEVFGIPVATVNREEGPAFGAALLAAVGIGAFSNIAAAARATIARQPAAVASLDAHRAYDEAYARFRESYHA
ncbi:MAG: hypothetical protein DMD26_00145 [Gemmatimonadetes bacterium]|nr:MAG: hypothetical protein DMD26_00145 [Gemmatimonadota bacterium]